MNGTVEELWELAEKDAIDLSALAYDDRQSLTDYITENLLEGRGANDDGRPDLADILRELGCTSEEDLDCIESFGWTYSDALDAIDVVYTNPYNPYGMSIDDYHIEDIVEHFDGRDRDVQIWFLNFLDLDVEDIEKKEDSLPILIYLKYPNLVENLGVYDSDTISKLRELLPSNNITSLEDLVEVILGIDWMSADSDTELLVLKALLNGDLSYEDVAPFILELQIYLGVLVEDMNWCNNSIFTNDELCELNTIIGTDYNEYLCNLDGIAYCEDTVLSDGYYWGDLGLLNDVYLEDILTSVSLLTSAEEQFNARCGDGKIILSRILDSIEYCCSYYIDETVSILNEMFSMFSDEDLLSDIFVDMPRECMQELISNGLSLKVANMLV